MIYKSASYDETAAIARNLAEKAAEGDIFCLCGQLGAGKTSFAQGFAKGLGFDGYVNSPTFTLMQVYEGGRHTVYHFDLYRLAEENSITYDSLDDIGFFDTIEADGVSLIEWADCARDFIPKNAVWIKIEADSTDLTENRIISVCKNK